MKFYCVKCKKHRESAKATSFSVKNKKTGKMIHMMKGKCPKCDITMCKIVSKKK